MIRVLKRCTAIVLGEYALYQVWRSPKEPPSFATPAGFTVCEVSEGQLRSAYANELSSSAWYLGEDACGFAAVRDGEMLALACCWWGSRYLKRHSWPLPDGAAKIVHVFTLPQARGMGLAPLLLEHARATLQCRGRSPLYARIWHSNTPSLRAFARAKWQPVGWLIQVNPLRRARPWRFIFRNRAT